MKSSPCLGYTSSWLTRHPGDSAQHSGSSHHSVQPGSDAVVSGRTLPAKHPDVRVVVGHLLNEYPDYAADDAAETQTRDEQSARNLQ